MTEEEWGLCGDPVPMLAFLAGRADGRKLRLFACACTRRVWGRLEDLARAAVEVAECFADGTAGAAELRAARLACKSAGASASWYAAASDPAVAARNAALSAQSASGEAERFAQAALLREVFGPLPFRPVAVEPGWLRPGVVRLARTVYEERAFDRLPALADLLQQAGCANAELLAHCRSGGPHVRGCWAVDVLLGKPWATPTPTGLASPPCGAPPGYWGEDDPDAGGRPTGEP